MSSLSCFATTAREGASQSSKSRTAAATAAMGTYASDVLFVHVSSPDDDEYVETDHSGDCAEHRHALEEPVETDHAGDCAEHRHALEELLGSEHSVEVDRVRRHGDVASERRQVSTQALRLGVRCQRSHLAYTNRYNGLFIYLFIHSLTYSLTHSLIHSLIHPFTHSHIHSLFFKKMYRSENARNQTEWPKE